MNSGTNLRLSTRELEEGDSVTVDTLIRPFRYSDPLFIDLIGQASGKQIKQIEDYHRPKTFETLAGVAADSLYKWMLQPSDNLFAEPNTDDDKW